MRQGTRVVFVVEGDHAVLRPAVPERTLPPSGFGIVKVSGPAVPADFDVASLLKPVGKQSHQGCEARCVAVIGLDANVLARYYLGRARG